MNASEPKLGKKVKVSMLTGTHNSVKRGEIGLVAGFPIVLVKLSTGKLERFYCHEIEEIKGDMK